MSGFQCDHAIEQYVEVDRKALMANVESRQTKVRTKISGASTGMVKLCPYCDAYALGAEDEVGLTVRTASGEEVEIHSIIDL